MQEFIIPFGTILIAELGDKSFLAVTYLSSKTKKTWPIFAGAICAYLLLNGLTVFAGSALTSYIDLGVLKLVSGVIFILFGLKTLITKEDEDLVELKSGGLFRSTFGLILLSEIGDKTNISAGLFATQYSPIIVLMSVTLALALITIIAIQLGKWVTKKWSHEVIANIGGVVFILIGISLIILYSGIISTIK